VGWAFAAVAVLLLTAAGVLWLHMRRIEPERIEIVRREILFDDLPAELHGIEICHISDTHITEDPRNSHAVAEAIASVRADLYVFTGDLIHGPKGVDRLAEWLDSIGRPLRPAVAVFGNAEHKRRISLVKLRELLAERGIVTLINESVVMDIREAQMQIVGLDDPHSGHSRAATAYAHADANRWTLVLMHSPEGVLELDGRRADLVLAGHTHGGQILLPGIGWVSDNTHNRVGLISGLYNAEDLAIRAGLKKPPSALYVSRGLGTSGWPIRLRCRPELPIFVLRRIT